MPGLTLGIGETNPKKGAIQSDARRVDGVEFVIPTAASLLTAPIGSVVTLQEETTSGKQIIVLGEAVYADDEYSTYAIISLGFLEAASQASTTVNQTVGEYADGDYVAMISDINAVAASPYDTGNKPVAGSAAYVNAKGQLTSSSSSAVAFPGEVWYGTPGIQNSGQLKTGYAFARLTSVTVG